MGEIREIENYLGISRNGPLWEKSPGADREAIMGIEKYT